MKFIHRKSFWTFYCAFYKDILHFWNPNTALKNKINNLFWLGTPGYGLCHYMYECRNQLESSDWDYHKITLWFDFWFDFILFSTFSLTNWYKEYTMQKYDIYIKYAIYKVTKCKNNNVHKYEALKKTLLHYYFTLKCNCHEIGQRWTIVPSTKNLQISKMTAEMIFVISGHCLACFDVYYIQEAKFINVSLSFTWYLLY